MSYRTVLLHCLMQSEMLFCMFRPEIPCLSQYSFYAFNFSPPHLFPFTPEQFSTGGISTSTVLCHLLKQMGAKDLILHPCNQGSAAAEWMHRHIKLMVQKNIHTFTSQWSLSSGPWGLQHTSSTARVEGKWLFTGCSSTHRAIAGTHAVQDAASCIFMQCMTESSWSSEGF